MRLLSPWTDFFPWLVIDVVSYLMQRLRESCENFAVYSTSPCTDSVSESFHRRPRRRRTESIILAGLPWRALPHETRKWMCQTQRCKRQVSDFRGTRLNTSNQEKGWRGGGANPGLSNKPPRGAHVGVKVPSSPPPGSEKLLRRYSQNFIYEMTTFSLILQHFIHWRQI